MRLLFGIVSALFVACGTVCVAPGQSAPSVSSSIPGLASCSVPAGKEPWRDAHQTPECRTLEVIHSMSLPEKLQRLDNSSGAQSGTGQSFFQVRAADGPNGIARGPFPGPPPPSALGVTAFPNEIVVASTWDRDMADQFGRALAEEWRGKGLSEIVGPTLNMMRTWHWGRSAETYGEDPFLTGEMASAEVAAIQSEQITTFPLSDLKLRRNGNTVNLELMVKNVGTRSGFDVVQVYVEEPAGAEEPPSQLKGFAKVNLQPGERKQVTITLPVKSLAWWSEGSRRWELSPGTYEFKVGESSRDFQLRGHLSLAAESF